METPVSVRDVMDRSYVGVNEGDTVAGAAGLMDDAGTDVAIVLRGGEPVGLLRAIDVVSLVGAGRDPAAIDVGSAMTDRVVTISVDDSLDAARSALTGDGYRTVVVTDDGTVEGVIGDHDLLTTGMVAAPVDAVDRATGRTGPVSERDVDGLQGVCEVCGSLTSDLVEQNGQMLCPDCVSV